MYCFTKSPSTNPGLVGTLSQYSLTDQTNYIHFSWALDRGNTFGKLEMMIVIQVQTLSWTPWTPQKGARLMHPGYEQQKTLEGVEMKATSKFSQEIFFEDVFLLYPFWKCEWNGWKLETCDLPILIPPLRVLSQLKSQASSIWSWRSKNLRMMFPAVWCLVISTLSVWRLLKGGPQPVVHGAKKTKV